MDIRAAQRALEALPTDQREVVVLRIWAGLTFQEAADTVGEPLSTLFSRYAVAITALRKELEKR